MTSGYGEEYLKMSDDSASGGHVLEQVQPAMDEENNNNNNTNAVMPNSLPSPVPLMIAPADGGHGPQIEMISMQTLSPSLPEEDEEEADEHEASHYDNLDQVVVKEHHEVSNGSLKHGHVQVNHQYVSQPIQQTIL